MELFDSAAIGRAFREEVEALGGRVTECVELDRGLFARSVRLRPMEVRPRDRVQGGVALRADEEGIRVRPYIFRRVCSNGAIAARALEARTFERESWRDPASLEAEVREAVRACGSDEAFEGFAQRVAGTVDRVADYEINLVAHLSTHGGRRNIPEVLKALRVRRLRSPPTDRGGRAFALAELEGASPRERLRMLEHLGEERDRTRFGLLNAVTAVARDTPDPVRKWDLEELGGEIAYLKGRPRPVARRREARALAVV